MSPRLSSSRVSGRPDGLAGYALAGPAAAGILVLVVGPTIAVAMMALTNWQLGAPTFSFVGLDNFEQLIDDPTFRAALTNTAIYVAVVVPVTITLGLATALIIESRRSLRSFYRTIHFLPVMATLTAMALSWEAMLHPTIGLVNQLLEAAGIAGQNWLNDRAFVLPTLIVIGIWQHLGLAMVVFLAGIKTIPRDLYEAADVDGVETWLDRLRLVTLPMLGPVTMFVTVIIVLRSVEVFDTVQVLTQGGPGNSSETLLHTLYVESFSYFRAGYGAAITMVFLAIVVIITLVQARIMERRVHYS